MMSDKWRDNVQSVYSKRRPDAVARIIANRLVESDLKWDNVRCWSYLRSGARVTLTDDAIKHFAQNFVESEANGFLLPNGLRWDVETVDWITNVSTKMVPLVKREVARLLRKKANDIKKVAEATETMAEQAIEEWGNNE